MKLDLMLFYILMFIIVGLIIITCFVMITVSLDTLEFMKNKECFDDIAKNICDEKDMYFYKSRLLREYIFECSIEDRRTEVLTYEFRDYEIEGCLK